MLPLQQAYEIQYSIWEYLKATFSFKDRAVHEAFDQFISHPEDGMFKGPYISLKLPFVKAQESEHVPLDIRPDFPPYDHQYQAFRRLSTQNGHRPQSTLITTGTSSGKTECFLYPVLDYCYQNLHRPGIKVIILYPMNALATDQAKRLAEAIWADSRLKGKVTAGLFIGLGKDKKMFPGDMGEHHIIENRERIVSSPPDILLTNFKMLDFALMQNGFHNLWGYNLEDPSVLQFLVLDELHTYDGAQGTDVANLIRRLKLKLRIPKGQICAVGTSATIGSGGNALQSLTEYAEKVFGETFGEGAIITENRVSVEAFFGEDTDDFLPRQITLTQSRLQENETYESYVLRQKRVWGFPESVDKVALGEELKKLEIVRDMVALTSQKIVRFDDLLRQLSDVNKKFRDIPEWDAGHAFSPRAEVLNSLLALISEARVGGERKFPFLYLQVQLWIRELSGVLRELGEQPVFTWKDKVGDKYDRKALPAYFCRDCGASGWLGVKDDNKNHFNSDTNQVYSHFFDNHKNIWFVNTENHRRIEEYEPSGEWNLFLDPVALTLSEQQGEQSFKINAVRKLRSDNANKSKHICPECNTENTLAIIGTRVATLSSITVSQVLSSDLDPRADQYRKILAFTNSVQDAAHQAGFVEARNYRFTFRASLQKIINRENRLWSIPELQAAFVAYWKANADESGKDHENAYYYRFFPADYAKKVDISSDYRDRNQHFTEAFKQEFDLRMGWEIAAEFGYNATIGRTLEKSGASAVLFEEEKLKAIFPLLKPWMDLNNLPMITAEELLPFVNGILHRVRTRGGVDHPYLNKFREDTNQIWDLNWMRDNRHFLNKQFHPRARFPKLLTSQIHPRGILDSTYTHTNNWYRHYFTKTFLLAPNHTAIVNDFYQQLLEAMVHVGLMNKKGGQDTLNYAIAPESIRVENNVKQLQCNVCGSVLPVAASDGISHQTKCLAYTCTGSYSTLKTGKPNYYQLVYNRQRAPRIYAAEHTGMLERKDRERKEIDFKTRPNFNSLNAIVATSTLEMGIDIGTLNSAINNSVAPLTSNFLQRVGRAGRSSGSALILNFAQSKAHDLFYYGEPKDMMEGEIATPGCFLEAKDILFRHFFAYCLDNWSSADYKNHHIPHRLLSLRLLQSDVQAPDFWGNRIISYIKANERHLLEQFIAFYQNDLGDAKVLDDLRTFLREESFYIRIRQVFTSLKQAYTAIFEQRRDIEAQIKKDNLPESDEERKILESEKKALWGIKRLLDNRMLVEHLTNVGLLPNYAFPETGVTLNALVRSAKAKASDSIPTDRQFEIVRASAAALREFAPGNHFYSQGFRFEITGLNTFDWKDTGTLLVKRFCSNCDHIADKAVSAESTCPKCGDASWASAKNHHVFVRLKGVKSVNTREKSSLDDSSDEREQANYRISRHVKFDKNAFQGAWGMKEIPFGIEYVKNVDIIEVNLGLSSSTDANKISINQLDEVPHHGFVTCKYCGKSTSAPHLVKNNKDLQFHFGYCKHKAVAYQNKADEVFEEVYLLREIKTEGLKVLLPVQELESDAQVNMFKAGLELGLKKYYKGNPQHLSIIDYMEYNAQNSRFDKYLVIYDSIPGGTGYLEELFAPQDFTTVIELAYQAIKDCTCQFQGKDGCYRCIYTYANQYNQSELSRKKAEKLFQKIVEKSNAWEPYSTGLGALSGNGQIEESELEERFVRSLRHYFDKKGAEQRGIRFESVQMDGVVNYKMQWTEGEYTFYYLMRPQYDLGPSEGVKYKTRADFYIRMTHIERNGQPLDHPGALDSTKSIAVYLDGYTYHATQENCRFYNDLQKRMAIAATGNKISWTLTWDDLERFDQVEKDGDTEGNKRKYDDLKLDYTKYRATIDKYKSLPQWQQYRSDLPQARNSIERLLWILAHPLDTDRVTAKTALLFALRQEKFGVPSLDLSEVESFLQHDMVLDPKHRAKDTQTGNFYVIPEIPDCTAVAPLKIAVKLSDFTIKSSVGVIEGARTYDKEQWMLFWQIFNLVQSDCIFVESGNTREIHTQGAPDNTTDNAYDCLQYFDAAVHPIVRLLIDHQIEFNREGGFFVEQDGQFAEAVLGFEVKKVFICPLSESDKKLFVQAGFTEIEPAHFNINQVI